MRDRSPFLSDDLAQLDEELLAKADAVVAMEDIFDGNRAVGTIGLRHDVDNVFAPALRIARWEADRGYRATYFVLHSAPYWTDRRLREGLEEIASLGHEIGIHTNAISVALRTGNDPDVVLMAAIDTLRIWGFPVRGVVGHGDPLCYEAGFVNDEQFTECARPEMGPPTRMLRHRNVSRLLVPRPLADFGLEYESVRLGRAAVLSDSGGRWHRPFDEACTEFPSLEGQLHILWHPDWWGSAFAEVKAAA